MISDPVIASEVLNRKDFDKEWRVYKSIAKVRASMTMLVDSVNAGGHALLVLLVMSFM